MTPIDTDRTLKRDVEHYNQHFDYFLYPNLDTVYEHYIVRLPDPDRDYLFVRPLQAQGVVDFPVRYITEQVDDDDDGDNNIRLYLRFLIGLFTGQLDESLVESVINQLSNLIGVVNARLSRLIELIYAYLIAQLNEVLDEWIIELEHQAWCESLVHRSVLSSEQHGESDFLRTFIEYLAGYFNRNLTTDHTEQLIEQLIRLTGCPVDFIRPLLRLLIVQNNSSNTSTGGT
jgi:hypothetical protein